MKPPRIDRKIDEITDLVKAMRKLNWTDLERRLADATRRDLTAGTRADGFPRSTTGSSTQPRPPADHDHDDRVDLTSVEADADARGFGRTRPDELHQHLRIAVARLRRMVEDSGVLEEQLNDIDRITNNAADPELCESCDRAGVRTDSSYYSDVVGRINRPMRLCNNCYMHVYRHAEPGAQLTPVVALPDPSRIHAGDERRYKAQAS